MFVKLYKLNELLVHANKLREFNIGENLQNSDAFVFAISMENVFMFNLHLHTGYRLHRKLEFTPISQLAISLKMLSLR